jgi:hypothetical protein
VLLGAGRTRKHFFWRETRFLRRGAAASGWGPQTECAGLGGPPHRPPASPLLAALCAPSFRSQSRSEGSAAAACVCLYSSAASAVTAGAAGAAAAAGVGAPIGPGWAARPTALASAGAAAGCEAVGIVTVVAATAAAATAARRCANAGLTSVWLHGVGARKPPLSAAGARQPP